MLPNQKISRHILRLCGILLLFSILVLTAVWPRIYNGDTIPKGQFTETDGYFYYYQAQLISEQGDSLSAICTDGSRSVEIISRP